MLTVTTLMYTVPTLTENITEKSMKNSNSSNRARAVLCKVIAGDHAINKKYENAALAFLFLALSILAVSPASGRSIDAVPVTVAPVKFEQRGQVIRNSGRISHENEMHLSFKTGGLIEQIDVEEGDEVNEKLRGIEEEGIEGEGIEGELRTPMNWEGQTAASIGWRRHFERFGGSGAIWGGRSGHTHKLIASEQLKAIIFHRKIRGDESKA
jgi:hypothetical protein